MKCECCLRRITGVVMNKNRKYCGNCALHNLKQIREISRLKNDIKKLRLKLYGQERGNERIRFKNEKETTRN
jgi:hypothetical protein